MELGMYNNELRHYGRQRMHWYKHLPDVAARLNKRRENKRYDKLTKATDLEKSTDLNERVKGRKISLKLAKSERPRDYSDFFGVPLSEVKSKDWSKSSYRQDLQYEDGRHSKNFKDHKKDNVASAKRELKKAKNLRTEGYKHFLKIRKEDKKYNKLESKTNKLAKDIKDGKDSNGKKRAKLEDLKRDMANTEKRANQIIDSMTTEIKGRKPYSKADLKADKKLQKHLRTDAINSNRAVEAMRKRENLEAARYNYRQNRGKPIEDQRNTLKNIHDERMLLRSDNDKKMKALKDHTDAMIKKYGATKVKGVSSKSKDLDEILTGLIISNDTITTTAEGKIDYDVDGRVIYSKTYKPTRLRYVQSNYGSGYGTYY